MIAIIAYDFPHVKTCDFILALKYLDYDIDCVLAAPWRELDIPKPTLRIDLKRDLFFHPRQISDILGIPYYSIVHDSDKFIEIVEERGITLGIVAGARILKKKTISAFSEGILNFHPGLIPENRGLDTCQWAIYLDIPQGVTTHFIDWRVDAGRLIFRKEIPLFKDDTIFDVQKRLYDTQLKMIKPTLETTKDKPQKQFKLVKTNIKYRSKMPAEIETKIPELFKKYILKRGI